MGRMTTTFEQAHSEVQRLSYAGLDAETLLRRAVERIRRALPMDLYCLHMTDPASGLITHGILSDPAYEGFVHDALEHVYFEDDVMPFRDMARTGTTASSLTDTTDGRRGDALRYRRLMKPMGAEYEIRGVFAADGELWGCITIMREPGSPDFNDREVAFVHRIAPHIAAGLRAAVLRSAAQDRDGIDSAPGVLELDDEGQLVHYTSSAEHLLADIGLPGSQWRNGTGLPPAILSISGALKRTVRSGLDSGAGDVPRLLIQGRSGRWFALYGMMTEPVSAEACRTMIVIEPARPREIAWLKTAAYGLTEREEEVVDLVVRGASTRQISDRLFISQYTVQEHLSNIFEKVGERSRRALVKRLYLEGIV